MDVFETIFPILAIAGSGYLIARKAFLSRTECDAITKFVFTYVIPAMLFSGTARADFPPEMEWQFLLGYYAVVLVVYLLTVFCGKTLFAYNATEQSVFGMGAAYSNATIIGIPVVAYALGEEALLPLFLILSVQNLALFSVGTIVAERDQLDRQAYADSVFKLVRQFVTSPTTGSLIAGGLVNLLNIPIYEPLGDAVALLGSAAVPAALFVLGTSLNRYHIRGHLRSAVSIVVVKLVLLPVLVGVLVLLVFDLDPMWAATALVTAALPTGVSAYIFSQRYQVCEAPVATAILLSTVGSVVTLGVVLTAVNTWLIVNTG